MFGGLAELLVDREPLRSATQTGVLNDRSEAVVSIERLGFHHCIGFKSSPAYDPVAADLGVGGDVALAPAAIPSWQSPFYCSAVLTAVSTAC